MLRHCRHSSIVRAVICEEVVYMMKKDFICVNNALSNLLINSSIINAGGKRELWGEVSHDPLCHLSNIAIWIKH